MAFSNLVAFFILVTAVTLHASGTGKRYSNFRRCCQSPAIFGRELCVFALGIIGAGLLAIPFLAGSAAYAIAETFRWRDSLESKPRQAPKFYIVLAAATIIGMSLHFLGMDPIRVLYWSAVINGVVAVPLMLILMIMSANRRIIGKFLLPPHLHIIGWSATIVMFPASLAFILSGVHGLF
jgi:Mn2+/Fe2+ NRAMP family transporter